MAGLDGTTAKCFAKCDNITSTGFVIEAAEATPTLEYSVVTAKFAASAIEPVVEDTLWREPSTRRRLVDLAMQGRLKAYME